MICLCSANVLMLERWCISTALDPAMAAHATVFCDNQHIEAFRAYRTKNNLTCLWKYRNRKKPVGWQVIKISRLPAASLSRLR